MCWRAVVLVISQSNFVCDKSGNCSIASHMEREHLPPFREKPTELLEFKRDTVEMKSYVGGLVKSFERKAA